jgi:hypothetical protein
MNATILETPDAISSRSPDSIHVRGSESSHQQTTVIADKSKGFIVALYLSIALNGLFAYVVYVETYALRNQNQYLKSDTIMPLQSEVSEHDKEIQMLMIMNGVKTQLEKR